MRVRYRWWIAAGCIALGVAGCRPMPPGNTPAGASQAPTPERLTLRLDTTLAITQEGIVSLNLPAPTPEVGQAIKDLAHRLAVDADMVTVVDYAAVTWPDSSLGCPQPGMQYLQSLREGMRIRLQVRGTVYEYHSGQGRAPFLCTNPTAPAAPGSTAPTMDQ